MRYLIEFTDEDGSHEIRTDNKVLAGELFSSYSKDLKVIIKMTDEEAKTKQIKNYW